MSDAVNDQVQYYDEPAIIDASASEDQQGEIVNEEEDKNDAGSDHGGPSEIARGDSPMSNKGNRNDRYRDSYKTEEGEDCQTLYIRNLPGDFGNEDIRREFSKFGEIVDCRVVINPVTKDSRGFGFVQFKAVEMAEAARERMDGVEIRGKPLRIEKARRNRPHDPTPGEYKGPTGASIKYDNRGRLKPGYVPYWTLPYPKHLNDGRGSSAGRPPVGPERRRMYRRSASREYAPVYRGYEDSGVYDRYGDRGQSTRAMGAAGSPWNVRYERKPYYVGGEQREGMRGSPSYDAHYHRGLVRNDVEMRGPPSAFAASGRYEDRSDRMYERRVVNYPPMSRSGRSRSPAGSRAYGGRRSQSPPFAVGSQRGGYESERYGGSSRVMPEVHRGYESSNAYHHRGTSATPRHYGAASGYSKPVGDRHPPSTQVDGAAKAIDGARYQSAYHRGDGRDERYGPSSGMPRDSRAAGPYLQPVMRRPSVEAEGSRYSRGNQR